MSFFLLLSNSLWSQDYNLRFEKVSNNGTTLTVKVQMSLTSAENLGTSNLVFTYDGAELNTPVLGTIHNFSGGNYDVMTLTSPASNTVSLNIVLNTDNVGTALATGSGFTDVAEISFTLPNDTGTADFQWQVATTTKTVVYQDDNSTRLSEGTLTNNDLSLDATPPATPGTPDLAFTSDSGSEEATAGATSDNLTNDLTPTFEGTGVEASATIKVTSSVDGLLGSVAANGSGVWSFTPGSNMSTGAHNITATATDAATNESGASSALSITIKTTQPTVAVTTTSTNPTSDNPIPITVTFSEEADGFKESDITFTNATIGDFASADSTTFTANITPSGDGAITVDVLPAVATDQAGNNNTAATQLGLTYDGTGPALTNQALSQTAADALRITYQSNDMGTLYYIVSTNSSTPTQAQIKAGNDQSGNDTNVVSDGNAAVTTTGSDQTIDLTSLTLASTTYHVFLYQEDALNNEGSIVTNSAAADATAPTVSSSSPADDATGVDPSADITVTFNEDIQFGTGFFQLIQSADDVVLFSIDAADPTATSNVASISGAVLTINPGANLSTSTGYYLKVLNQTPFLDLTGNAFTGFTVKTDLNFTTIVPNSAPTFTIGANQTVSQSAGAQTVNSFISTFDDGDAGATQTTQFNITGNTNASLFTEAPAISATGVLTFTPDATKFGKATISVTISDDGGTDNGGVNTSAAQTFDIFITPDNIKINEVHASAGAGAEFIEVYNTNASATSLSGLVMVWFNGSGDEAYKDFDLSGSTSASGFYVIGETAFASKDQDWGTTSLQNGTDAVAIYVGSETDFTGSSAPTTDGLVDVIVYGVVDDAALRTALGNPALQVAGSSANSISRTPDGTGGYVAQAPSAQATNDVTPPTITNVSIPNSASKVSDAITVTITAGEAGLSLNSGTVNGVSVTGFSDDGGGSYSATYTVVEGNTDRAAGNDIPVSFVLTDAAGNSNTAFNTAISQNADAIDANSPSVTNVSIPNNATNVGDAITVTITASEAGLSLNAGSVNGVNVTGFSDDGAGSYSATYTVAEGNTDRAIGDDIPVSFVLDDGAGNSSATFTTAISQNADAIDANTPSVTAVSIPNSAANVGDAITVTITASEAGLSLNAGSVNGVNVTGFSDDGGGSYSATYTVVEGNTDRASGDDIPVSFVLDDGAGNSSATFNTAISQNADAIDANTPSVTAVSIPNSAANVGDAITVTITASEAGLSLNAGSVNGVNVTGFSDDGAGSYSATYTVVEGNTDRAAGDNIPVSFVLDDGAGNSSATFTTAISQSADAIDANTPSVTAVSIPNSAANVGDAITVTITASEAGLSLNAGSVNGVNVTGFSDDGGGSYSATYTVVEGNTDRAIGDDIPVSFVLDDGAGNSSVTFNTAISQNADAIDANSPSVTTVSIPNSATNVDDAITVTITASEAGLSLNSGTVNGVSVTGFSDDGAGSYSATYTVVEGNTDRAIGDDIPVSFVLDDGAGNSSATFNTAISQNADAIDANTPTITSVTIPNSIIGLNDAVTVTIVASEAGLSLNTGTVNGVTVTGFTDNGSGNYSATYTALAAQTERTAGDDIPVSFILDDAASNSSSTFNTVISQNADEIDLTAPTVTSVTATMADGTYGVGEVVAITVTFSESVTVGGTPQLELETGLTDQTVDFASGSPSNTLTFNYTIQSGDVSTDLDYKANNSLTLNGGSINDAAGNAATLTLANPAAPNSLGVNKDLVIAAEPTVTLSVGASSIAEAAGTSTVTATLSAASSNNVTVTLSYGGTATNGTDYNNNASPTITITAGQLSANTAIGITATQDMSPETNETIIVDITGVTNGSENGTQQETITILDDDTPNVAFVSSSSDGLESVSSTNIPVNLSIASGLTVTVNYAVTAGTATGSGTDFTLASGTLTFNPASTTENIPLAGIVNDLLDEADETVIITLSSPSNANLGTNTSHTYTITDNDDAPTIAFTSTTSSGAESVSSADLTVGLSSVSGQNVTVDYAITGTATGSGTDYTLANGTLIITEGANSDNITIASIVDDVLDEVDETVIVTLSNPVNATLGTNTSHTYTITDNDTAPTVAFASTSSDGLESVASANLQVDLSAVSGKDVMVDYTVTGTATGSGTDYTLADGTLTINASNANDNITIVSIVADALDENNETVIVTLFNPVNATLGTNTVHTYTITDDDTSPDIAFVATSSNGAESVNSANLQVGLTSVSGRDVMVDYTITGTASGSGTDYTLADGTLTITEGANADNITIASIIDDALDEVDETVIVTLSNPINATLGTNTIHTYTVNDNDTEPTVAFALATDSQMESESSQDIQVSLSAKSGKTITVDYAVSGTATAGGVDHTTTGGTITFNPGEQDFQQQITGIVDDALDEENETIILTLSNPGNATLGTNTVLTYTITDNDDEPTVTLSVGSASIAEAAGTSSVTATLSAVSGKDVTVTVAYTGTATNGTDYNNTASTGITINAGQMSASTAVGITATQDASPEGNETIIIDITGVTNGTEGGGMQQETITLVDDDAAVVTSVSSTTVNGNYKTGDIISIDINFNQPVDVSGTPQLTLETGTTDQIINYVSGSGSSTLTFTYTVRAGDVSADLDYVDANSLSLNFSSIMSNGLNAIVTLPTPGTTNSLGANAALVIDTSAPVDPVITAPAMAVLVNSASQTISGTHTENGVVVNLFADSDNNGTPDNSTVLAMATVSGNAWSLSATLTADAANNFVVQAIDAAGNTSSAVDVATITEDSANPVISSDGGAVTASINVNENTTAVTTVMATDANPVTFSITGGADQGLFGIASGVLTFTAAPDFENPGDADTDNAYVVEVTASDGINTDDTQTITVTVVDQDDNSPVITSDGGAATAALNVNENSTAVTTVTATDADVVSTVSYSISGGADQALFSLASGVLTFTAAPDFENPADAGMNNTYVVEVTATDGATTAVTQTITITVVDQDDNNPVITSDGGGATAALNGNENATAVTTVIATDADAVSTVAYSISGGADQALFSMTAGVLTFTNAPDFENPGDADTDNAYIVEVTATDGTTTADTQTITVTVVDQDDNSPVITSDGGAATAALNVNENATAVTTVTATDADGVSTVAYSISGGADQALFSMTAGVLTFTNAPDFESPADADMNNAYVIEVTATDGVTSVDTQTITVTITDVNDITPVIIASQSFAIDETAANSTAVGTVVATDGDASTTAFSDWTITAGNGLGIFTVDANTGAITVADNTNLAAKDVTASYTLSLTVSDGTNTSAVETVTINILDTTAPSIPTLTGIGTDTGSDANDQVTSDQTLSFSGTAEANGTVEVFIDGSSIGTVMADGSGNFTFDHSSTTLSEGSISVTAKARDAAANESGVSAALAVMIDTTVPSQPTLGGISDDNGPIGNDFITNDQSIIFSGMAEALSRVGVLFPGGNTRYTTADANGDWALDFSFRDFFPGSYLFSVTAEDVAGNTSAMSNQITLVIDIAQPSVSSITRADANPTTASSVDFTTTFSEDVAGISTSNFQLAFTGTQSANIASVTAVSANTYTITVDNISGEGSFGLNLNSIAGITDIAGNTLNNTFNGEVYSTNFIPTDITISSTSILENNAVGDAVGGFNTTDTDTGDNHTYSLVSGTGDTDNASFTITGNQLQAAEVFDLETKASYSIRVQTDDGRGGAFEKAFTITIDNVPEPDLRITGNNDIPATPLGITTNFDITLHNDGDAFLTVSSILYPTAFGGPVAGINIPAGGSQVVTMTFTPTLPQLYTGNITIVSNGGTGTLAVSADGAIITGVDSGTLSAEAINVYPNPASSIVTFDLSKFNGKALSIQLFDLSGNKTFSKENYQGATLELNISTYQQGVYLAYFTDGKDVVQKKFMIKK